jgi:hypothetical protein
MTGVVMGHAGGQPGPRGQRRLGAVKLLRQFLAPGDAARPSTPMPTPEPRDPLALVLPLPEAHRALGYPRSLGNLAQRISLRAQHHYSRRMPNDWGSRCDRNHDASSARPPPSLPTLPSSYLPYTAVTYLIQ